MIKYRQSRIYIHTKLDRYMYAFIFNGRSRFSLGNVFFSHYHYRWGMRGELYDKI